MRFREKFKQEQAKKFYYTKTLSASRRRIVVTGGKDLKSSAAYTPQFARAILRMWRECWEIGVDAIRMDHASMDYRQLWGCVFEGSATMEERSCFVHMVSCFEEPELLMERFNATLSRVTGVLAYL